MTDPAVEAIAAELERHAPDTFSQDSGMQCRCGSDSRFDQVRLHSSGAALEGRGEADDPPWKTIDEHRAQQVVRVLRGLVSEAMSGG